MKIIKVNPTRLENNKVELDLYNYIEMILCDFKEVIFYQNQEMSIEKNNVKISSEKKTVCTLEIGKQYFFSIRLLSVHIKYLYIIEKKSEIYLVFGELKQIKKFENEYDKENLDKFIKANEVGKKGKYIYDYYKGYIYIENLEDGKLLDNLSFPSNEELEEEYNYRNSIVDGIGQIKKERISLNNIDKYMIVGSKNEDTKNFILLCDEDQNLIYEYNIMLISGRRFKVELKVFSCEIEERNIYNSISCLEKESQIKIEEKIIIDASKK
ncbi:MAG: hypothetical protein R3Y13_01200 [bacterium]